MTVVLLAVAVWALVNLLIVAWILAATKGRDT